MAIYPAIAHYRCVSLARGRWGMNNSISFDAHSARSQKARFAASLDNGLLRRLLWVIVGSLVVIWAWLFVFQHMAVAHLLLLPISLIITLLIWYAGELRDLKPSQPLAKAQDISQVLERRVLAKLSNNVSPNELAKVTAKQIGGYFYANRFALGPEFLANLLAGQTIEISSVWQQAYNFALENNLSEIDSVTIVAALILAIPGHDSFLASMQLDGNDITAGARWYAHLKKTIAYYNKRRSYGGFGRDLSFGWTPLLNQVGQNYSEVIERGGVLRRSVPSHEQVLQQVMHLLGQPTQRNAVLVGPVGVGKTTIVYALAQKLLEKNDTTPSELRYRQVINLDAANLIANAKGRGELEGLLIQIFNEAINAKNIILFLDEAQLFLKDGTGSVDLSSLLLPVLQGGALRIILSLSDQEWLRLSQQNPGLAQLMNRVVVQPLNESETLQVLEDQVLLMEAKHRVTYMYQSLHESYKLAERFINEMAFPGKAIKLLESAAGFPEQQHFVSSRSVKQAVEKSFGVKVQTADTLQERDVLLNLEQHIHERMINQTRAVKLVSDALRRARAGVRNESKPIGTFLFLGPTGVGKTELSKSLAAVYFGGEDHMVRIDLNEYSQATDTARLLATGGADPYSLCAQISKQPFSVVLLDEIEKAHPNVLNLLLQMLDEGILRDTENKPVSFKDAIIITTSNAGADKIRAHIDKGEALEEFEEEFVNELISSNTFRPEFLNRFDEIILFRPLTTDELVQVVDLLMNSLNKRLSAQKVSVALTPGAKQLLAQTGYDPRLGARPLRRVVQRAVENLVARHMLSGQTIPGQTLTFDVPEIQTILKEH
jgi:ATP-dependent Clp protease ATP-binding subunit ClpC